MALIVPSHGSTLKVDVRLFSLLRDRAGTARTELRLGPEATLRTALDALGTQFPALRPLLEGQEIPILLAVNREYATVGASLRDGDEVALFPPVSGGSGAVAVASPATEEVPSAKGLLLLSGGFDSPVAGHAVLQGGRRLDALHFTMEPFTDDASARKAAALARRLGLPRLTVVPLGDELAEFTRRCDHGAYFVLLKRLMLRVAQPIAVANGCSFFVTGENLGQVSSQTLANLAAIDAAAGLPVLRPLLGLDKQEIIAQAQRIGTYETSIGPELCDTLGPRHPHTGLSRARVEAEEAKLDVAALVQRALTKAFVVDVKQAGGASVEGGGPCP